MKKGPEWLKWELGIAYFSIEKMDLSYWDWEPTVAIPPGTDRSRL
jgi:hypothetical protein